MENAQHDVFIGLGVRVLLHQPDDFLKVKETLTRIGVASEHSKTIYQSCHILHKRGEYAIMHFKELFILDGKHSSLDDDDIGRRNTIANLLSQWKLVELVDPEECTHPVLNMNQVKVVSYRQKHEWTLSSKYQIGKK